MIDREEYEYYASQIVDAAIEVHRYSGPGLLESAYTAAFEAELGLRNVPCTAQVQVPVVYKGQTLNKYFQLDFLVAGLIVVELKSVDLLLPVHAAQTLSYLRLSDKKLGFLLNFNVTMMKEGIKRIVNHF